MEKGNKINTFLITIIVVLSISLGMAVSYIIIYSKYNNNQTVDTTNNTVVEKDNSVDNSETLYDKDVNNNNNNESSNSQDDDEIVKKLFISEYLEKSDEKLLSYRIDEIQVLNGEEKDEIVNMNGYKKDDILAYVKYSVKPINVNQTGWNAGNGEISGEWIVNKLAVVSVSNGKISVGTGW